MKYVILALALGFAFSAFAASISIPLPDNCAIQLSQDAAGNFSISCGGSPPPPPPPPGPDLSTCAALGLNPIVVSMPWATNYYVGAPTFGPNDALIIKFTTGSNLSGTNQGHISAYEFGGPQVPRAGALSDKPCDFTVGLPKYQSTGSTWFNFQNPSFSFTVGGGVKGKAVLQPNTTYYLNIANIVPAPPPLGGDQECYVANCPMQVTLTKPAGT